MPPSRHTRRQHSTDRTFTGRSFAITTLSYRREPFDSLEPNPLTTRDAQRSASSLRVTYITGMLQGS